MAALNDEFMSASVIKIRAGHPSTGRVDAVREACRELERRGLAEHAGSGRRSTSRWRRACRTGLRILPVSRDNASGSDNEPSCSVP